MDDNLIIDEMNIIRDFLSESYGSLSLINKYNEDKPAFRQNVNNAIDAMQKDSIISDYVGQNMFLDESMTSYNELCLKCDGNFVNL